MTGTTPFRAMMAISIHVCGTYAQCNWPPEQWNSEAGKDARAWMLREGLMTDAGEPTDRLEVWVRAMLRTPVPARAGAV